jgi:hypothetical protein
MSIKKNSEANYTRLSFFLFLSGFVFGSILNSHRFKENFTNKNHQYNEFIKNSIPIDVDFINNRVEIIDPARRDVSYWVVPDSLMRPNLN